MMDIGLLPQVPNYAGEAHSMPYNRTVHMNDLHSIVGHVSEETARKLDRCLAKADTNPGSTKLKHL
jgi:hypothetical protein